LTLGSFVLAPSQPLPDASIEDQVAWFVDNAAGIQAGAVVFALASLVLVVWLAGMVEATRSADGSPEMGLIAGIGMAVLAAGWSMSGAIGGGIAIKIEQLGPDAVQIGVIAAGGAASLGGVGLALALGALAVLLGRSGSFPRWCTPLAWAGAVAELASLAASGTDNSTVFGLVFLGFFLAAVFIAVTSVVLLRSPAEQRA
jgi:hypothetical protein